MDFFVTGGTGFVGQHLIPLLARHGKVGVLVQPGGRVLPRLQRCDVIEGDLMSYEGPVEAPVIVHLAAEANPQACEENPARAVRINVEGTQRVLGAAPKGARFVFISTGQVFGPTEEVITEARKPDPQRVYGATKLAAEALVWAAHRATHVDAVVLRPFNMYGPGQAGPYVVPDILRQLSKDEIAVRCLEPARDFTFISDAAELIARAATSPMASGQTIHIASGTTLSVRQVAEAAMAASDRRIPLRAQEIGDSSDVTRVDPRKAKEILGWAATTSLEAGLRATLDHDA